MTALRATVLDRFAEHRCSAILRTKHASAVGPALRAAVRGGFRIVEVTMNTVGAGTILTVEHAKNAMAAGAQFLVSPVTDPQVINFCRQHDVVSVPGTFPPTEMMPAHSDDRAQ